MPREMELIEIVRSTPWFMRALRAVPHLRLPSWRIGAGALRNASWDALDEKSASSPLADIDVAPFDRVDLSRRRDHEIEGELGVSSRTCHGRSRIRPASTSGSSASPGTPGSTGIARRSREILAGDGHVGCGLARPRGRTPRDLTSRPGRSSRHGGAPQSSAG
jgi:hypothetical protein